MLYLGLRLINLLIKYGYNALCVSWQYHDRTKAIVYTAVS